MAAAFDTPMIMAAPNGARRGKADHPRIPITIDEIVETAVACHAAGAGAVHAHVRDATGRHLLDADAYRELMARLKEAAPDMPVQITTESAGRYEAAQQMALVRDLRPYWFSAAIREIVPSEAHEDEAREFYGWCDRQGLSAQHILYDVEDIARLGALIERGVIPANALSVIYVLGRYVPPQDAAPDDLLPFLHAAKALPVALDWMVCAFGRQETACLTAALRAGGKVRVGFENNTLQADGSPAISNEAQVATIARIARDILFEPLTPGARR